MRVRQEFLIVLMLAGGLAVAAGIVNAASVADLNSLSGASVTSSATYSGFASPSALVNGVAEGGSPFIFADNQAGNYVNISNLRGGSFSTLRLFDDGWDQRTSGQVTVYYSTANTTSLDPNSYTSLGSTSLTVVNNSYANVTSTSSELGQNGTPVHYADVNVAVPMGTQSMLLAFRGVGDSAGNAGSFGPVLAEVQGYGAVGDQNLLSGKTVTTTSYYENMPLYVPSHVTDGAVGGTFVFSDGDTQRSMAITGFDSNVSLIRIWKGGDRVPNTVSIGYTTVADSVNPSDYTSLLDVTGLLSKFNAAGYADIAVNAPTGTKGLGFVWGAGDNAPGSQILEVQAFATAAPVPEPSALVLVVCGLFGFLAYAWRKRK